MQTRLGPCDLDRLRFHGHRSSHVAFGRLAFNNGDDRHRRDAGLLKIERERNLKGIPYHRDVVDRLAVFANETGLPMPTPVGEE